MLQRVLFWFQQFPEVSSRSVRHGRDKRPIVVLQAELAQHLGGRAAALLVAITTSASNAGVDDREFREFVRRLVG